MSGKRIAPSIGEFAVFGGQYMKKAVFLDRDGTINVDKGYVYKPEDFEFIDGAPEVIKIINKQGYLAVVVSNQSGIARGLYTADDVDMLHEHINMALKAHDAHIDAYYYCPHHPDFGAACKCRKPKPGLIEQAVVDYDIDIAQSWMIGDKESDIECARAAGIHPDRIINVGAPDANLRNCALML